MVQEGRAVTLGQGFLAGQPESLVTCPVALGRGAEDDMRGRVCSPSPDHFGPIRVGHFAARLIGALVGVGAEEVALGLQ